jgi:hypothetical protein
MSGLKLKDNGFYLLLEKQINATQLACFSRSWNQTQGKK